MPIAASWRGTAWRLTTPLGAGRLGSSLNGVSCVSDSCVAVGGYTFELGPETPSGGPLVDRWANGRWSSESAPQYIATSGGASSPFKWATGLASVSCVSAMTCVAVGTADPPGNGAPEAFGEISDGHGWRVESAGLPHLTVGRGALFAELTAVDCVSADACLAVGETYPETEHHVNTLLAARWNGHRFVPESGLGTSAEYGLYGVSCATVSSCTVVGNRTSSDGLVITPVAEAGGSA